MSELADRRDRCGLIAELCLMRFSRAMSAQDIDQLVRLVGAIAAEEAGDDTRALNADGSLRYAAKVTRLGRLARALVAEFHSAHPVWDYVRWG